MYSEKIRSLLEEKGVSKGDRVRVEDGDSTYEGILMPRSKAGNNDCIVIKLDNGYNIGIESESVDIKKIEEGKSEKKEEKSEPVEDADIAILHTGGTIASKVSYSEGGVVSKFSPQEIMDMYPELDDIASIRSKLISQMLSEDMEFAHYKRIAEEVQEQIEDGVEGVIISHGTDTMHYTSAALSFVLKNVPVPVILVGSQRSSDRPSSDAAMNLISAARFIKETEFGGVGICMHGSSSDNYCYIHQGTRARKMHTSRRDTFQTIGTSPVAKVNYPDGEIEFLQEVKKNSGEFEVSKDFENKVALVKMHPGMDPEIIEFYRDKEYKGIIIEGTGLGHAPVNPTELGEKKHEKLLESLKRFIEEEGIVAMTTQCLNGRVNMNVYETGRKLERIGVISGENMLSETAFVKLAWCLGNTDSREEAIEVFKENQAGEILEREKHDDFESE